MKTYGNHFLFFNFQSISIIEIMGLIGQYCGPCQRAANDPNGGGLAGRWWRGWAKASPASYFDSKAIKTNV